LLALAVMGLSLWFAAGSDASWLIRSPSERAMLLTGTVVMGAFCYFLMLWLLGFRLRDFSRRGME